MDVIFGGVLPHKRVCPIAPQTVKHTLSQTEQPHTKSKSGDGINPDSKPTLHSAGAADS